jgi:hypothetical protein
MFSGVFLRRIVELAEIAATSLFYAFFMRKLFSNKFHRNHPVTQTHASLEPQSQVLMRASMPASFTKQWRWLRRGRFIR